MSDMNASDQDEASLQPDPAAPVAGVSGLSPETTAVLESLVESHKQEVAELKDKMLRVLAEMENLRRRTEREVADARTYGIAAFARDMLAVADNMRRAIEVVPPEFLSGADAGVKVLVDGIELTERELLKALDKNGVKKFEPLGEKFNPNLHQAMYEVPDETVPAGMVVQVMQPGYMIGERILRPAFVGISKGGPKMAPPVSEIPQI